MYWTHRDHHYFRVHQSLGAVACSAEVVLQRGEQENPWRYTENRPRERDRRDALLKALDNNGDGHVEGWATGDKNREGYNTSSCPKRTPLIAILSPIATDINFSQPRCLFFSFSTHCPSHGVSMSPHEDDEDYFLPLEDQRVFGAGIRRKRVPFVRSSEHELNTTTPARPSSTTPSGASIAGTYLSIVLKQPGQPNTSSNTPTDRPASSPPRTSNSAPPTSESTPPPPRSPPPTDKTDNYCEICNLPFQSNTTDSNKPHEATLAHQVCLSHSHPPSALDRTRAGLRYLSTYGWDPDSRLGLGAPGREGIIEPLKGRVKHDTAGLGAGLDADGDRIRTPPPVERKVQKLNAKQARKGAVEARRRGEKMRKMFFQSDEVLKYLGEDG